MWDLPRPGFEPVSPALAGRFSTTAPPGKPWFFFFYLKIFFLIIIFYFNNFILFYFILIYFIFFLFFLPFILSCVDERLLVLQPGVRRQIGEPSSGHWSTRGLPAQRNIKRQKSPRDLHLNAKTQLHSTTSKLQCWTPYAKQLARQEHSPTH